MVQSHHQRVVIQQALAPSAQPAPVTPEATVMVPSPIPGATRPIHNCHLPCHYCDGCTETEQDSDEENIDIHADSDSKSSESQLAQDQGRLVDTTVTTAINTSTTNPLGTGQSNQGYLTQKAKNVTYNICHFFNKEMELTTCLPCMALAAESSREDHEPFADDPYFSWKTSSTMLCAHLESKNTLLYVIKLEEEGWQVQLALLKAAFSSGYSYNTL
ncbi:hypothetical protein EDD16DRAFT_1718454 [Pisolithus croceorrhizus]|nr:hypothetical protein EDD16DRAFT_1718454 [Pisolithus croceorrhizus]KAI6123896.1 hypothetical protein EV401DRAFT_2069111 [Pisolithus croceorrhizus]KAI6148173.1 hypothetical protein EDD17DRAFT_1767001 [Pisolithus thermaeus]